MSLKINCIHKSLLKNIAATYSHLSAGFSLSKVAVLKASEPSVRNDGLLPIRACTDDLYDKCSYNNCPANNFPKLNDNWKGAEIKLKPVIQKASLLS